MNTAQRFALVSILWLAGAGCDEIMSTDLETADMSAEIAVFADGSGGSEAEVLLRSGSTASLTFVELTGADILTATLGEDSVEMVGVDLAALHRYEASFDTSPPNETFTFALDREVDAGAPSSTLELPEPFDLGTLPASISDSDSLEITWSPSGESDAMSIRIEGSCISTFREDISTDDGAWTLPAGSLEPIDGDNPQSCTLDVRLTRSRAGVLDAGFGQGGTIAGKQTRDADVAFSP
ncbi:MAG: hypothetical protein KC912_11880 [Proteobacteria bacterium]|nr:hypothetical protein [Pseudomonadota bacterium]